MMHFLIYYDILFTILLLSINSELTSGRIKGDDEPQLVNWRVLEGVTEPFQTNVQSTIPRWKQLKTSADQRAADQLIQQALHEYGQILRHPYLFGEMPAQEKYDVFLSMAKLLKTMGFHQKSELLLYEAMSYTRESHEAHLQLGLLALEREDLEKAKLHFKNCLFFQENDLSMLAHSALILMAEGRTYEAKFYLGRLVSALEARLNKLSFLLSPQERIAIAAPVEPTRLMAWLEEAVVKVFHGEFRVTPAGVVELLRFASSLQLLLSTDELTGRFIFDLGTALYEKGRPITGIAMMRRGFISADPTAEGEVSLRVTSLRLALEVPLVPTRGIVDLLGSYLNISFHLAQTAASYQRISLENLMDLYWPLPVLGWAALPTAPLLQELFWRFTPLPLPAALVVPSNLPALPIIIATGTTAVVVRLGILAGHINDGSIGHTILRQLFLPLQTLQAAHKLHITLISLPVKSDGLTQRIASRADRIVNLPLSSSVAHLQRLIAELQLDVLLFPDYQPFPDQLAAVLQASRLAPVQACFFVRGSSCLGDGSSIDYYLLPSELEAFYLAAIPPAASNSTEDVLTQQGKRVKRLLRPAWREPFAEQVLLVDNWPIVNPTAMDSLLSAFRDGDEEEQGGRLSLLQQQASSFEALDLEGQLFFENQPVAVLPHPPPALHPLMDEALLRILRAVPSLHLVIAVPADFMSHEADEKVRMAWARQLVRRLWQRGAGLIHRIRLLPAPLSQQRLLQLMRQADVVLDSFPLGASLQPLGLALAAGTPVITLRSGAKLQSGKEELTEARARYLNAFNPSHPLAVYFAQQDLPWLPACSHLTAFYDRSNLAELLVANNTVQYSELAAKLLTNREFGYQLRVKLLEALDMDANQDNMPGRQNKGRREQEEETGGIAELLYQLGNPWSIERTKWNETAELLRKSTTASNKRKR